MARRTADRRSSDLHDRQPSCSSCRSVCRNKPPQDKEMPTAKRAPEGQQKPAEDCLKGVSVAYAPEID